MTSECLRESETASGNEPYSLAGRGLAQVGLPTGLPFGTASVELCPGQHQASRTQGRRGCAPRIGGVPRYRPCVQQRCGMPHRAVELHDRMGDDHTVPIWCRLVRVNLRPGRLLQLVCTPQRTVLNVERGVCMPAHSWCVGLSVPGLYACTLCLLGGRQCLGAQVC